MSGHTHIHTYTQDNYSNPRCACAPRVNDKPSTVTLAAHARRGLIIIIIMIIIIFEQDTIFTMQ